MKKIFYYLVAAMLLVACTKDDSVPTPEPPVSTNWKEWSFDAQLPDNFEETLIKEPCWVGDAHIGRVENGKVIIVNKGDVPLGGVGRSTFKFNEVDCDYYYMRPTFPTSYGCQKIEWSITCFLGFDGGVLGFVRDRSQVKEGAIIDVYPLSVGTHQILDEMIANLPNDSETE